MTTDMPKLASAPQAVLDLAKRLSLVHGPVRIAQESSGWHIYFASPYALEQDGIIELRPSHMHGALNAEKYLGLGAHAQYEGTGRNERCVQCMKYKVNYSVDLLLKMPPLDNRGLGKVVPKVFEKPTAKLIKDRAGNEIPMNPGKVVPLTLLPPTHPCMEFLRERRFTVANMNAFAPSFFCTEETPPSKEDGIFYSKFSGGFCCTPQNRLIMNGMMGNVRKTWQARLLQKTIDGVVFFLHPYTNKWTPVGRTNPETGKLELFEELKPKNEWEGDLRKMIRYTTAPGAHRNATFIGLDSATAFRDKHKTKTVFVVEGPLKAVRVRPPVVAVMGVFLSQLQARTLAKEFEDIVVIPDNDGDRGQGFIDSAFRNLSEFNRTPRLLRLRAGVKDPDEMPQDEADSFFRPQIRS